VDEKVYRKAQLKFSKISGWISVARENNWLESCPWRLKVNKGEKYNHSRLLNYCWIIWYIKKVIIKFTCTNLRNVHTPCKVQRWRSAESASSGFFEPSASSVHCLSDGLHAHVFPKMLRIPALDHNDRFVCSVTVSPPCVLMSLVSRCGCKCSWTDGLNSTVAKFCRDFFGFAAKIVFFLKKISNEFLWISWVDLYLSCRVEHEGKLLAVHLFPFAQSYMI